MEYPEVEERLFDGCEHRLPPVYRPELDPDDAPLGKTISDKLITFACPCIVDTNGQPGRFYRGVECDRRAICSYYQKWWADPNGLSRGKGWWA